jgi:predicted nucleic acid-binding protein
MAGEVFFFAAITASELLHGVERADTSERREKRSRYVEGVLHGLPLLDFDFSMARRHAALWAELEVTRQLIGPHDMLIAATALECDHMLVKLNRDEFARVKGIKLLDVLRYLIAKP